MNIKTFERNIETTQYVDSQNHNNFDKYTLFSKLSVIVRKIPGNPRVPLSWTPTYDVLFFLLPFCGEKGKSKKPPVSQPFVEGVIWGGIYVVGLK